MRSIWKGAISFGLVNIPVALYSAVSSAERIKFRMLRASDHSPIKYKRVAEADEQEVPWEQIVKGYEYERSQFVLLTDEDFERVEIKSTQIIEIKEFVSLDQIDPMFFDQPYLLGPEKGGDRAYALLRETLAKANKVGVSKVVLKTREHLAAVKPLGKALILELMHFPEELVNPNQLPLPDTAEPGSKEMAMALSLVDAMTEDWAPQKYHDEYAEALMKVIQEKIAAGGKELPAARRGAAPSTKVVDIVAMLQESLNLRTGGKAKPPAKKKARKTA